IGPGALRTAVNHAVGDVDDGRAALSVDQGRADGKPKASGKSGIPVADLGAGDSRRIGEKRCGTGQPKVATFRLQTGHYGPCLVVVADGQSGGGTRPETVARLSANPVEKRLDSGSGRQLGRRHAVGPGASGKAAYIEPRPRWQGCCDRC